MVLKKIKEKLSPTQKAAFRLAIWVSLIVWIVFFFAYSIVVAKILAGLAPNVFGEETWGQAISWVLPVWYVFTTLLIIALVAKWANRKLRSKSGED